ncbi:MAG TPA: winged helix-turn-helix domain-containing protein [Gaiellaceae bacterium]
MPPVKTTSQADGRGNWVFLSNHGNVLLCIARDPRVRISEIADRVGIGERAAQKIVADLVAAGYVIRTKEGRRNRYEINPRGHLRHPLFADLEIGPFIDVLRDGAGGRTAEALD